MKKIMSLIFVFIFSFSVFADGDLPNGGKSCSGNTSCVVEIDADKMEDSKSIFYLFSEFQIKLRSLFY